MASPEANRIGGPRPSGAGGVKNLLAMFEKSSSSPSGSPAPGNSSTTNPASRDQSPAPRPLGKVRTSFVAVTGNGGQMLGLQKVQVPPSPVVISPVVSVSEGAALAGEVQKKEGFKVEKEVKKDEVAETSNGSKTPDEPTIKKDDTGSKSGFPTPLKEPTTPPGTVLSSGLENVFIKEGVTTEKPLDPIPSENDGKEQLKPVGAEPKPKPTAAPVPKSPTKSTFSSNKTAKPGPTTKSGKTLSLPPAKSNTTSPLPSPAFPPKSPVRLVALGPNSGLRAKPATSAQGTSSSSTKPRTPASASITPTLTPSTTPTISKPRQPITAATKSKVSATQKTEPTKPVREPTKPPTIRSSAFAPTAASAAKLAADQRAATARSRPPSSASVRNKSPHDGSTGMRRGNSGMGSSRPGRKEQRSPQRPSTSAAIRNPNRSSVGSLASMAPGAAGDNFLSRMMRPTTASAGKVSDKKPLPMNPPQKRSASVASTSRRREASLPPTARLQKQKTGEKFKVDGTAVPEVKEPEHEKDATTEVTKQPEAERMAETANPTEVAAQVTVEQVTVMEAPTEPPKKNHETEAEANDEEDGGQSPTTTTSSTTLVHEGEDKGDGEEPAVLVKE